MSSMRIIKRGAGARAGAASTAGASVVVPAPSAATPTITLQGVVWYFMRVSGLLMLALVLGHLFIMHYLHAPSETTAAFVTARWANLLWQSFDWMLLMLALFHGLAGLQAIARDYLTTRMRRLASATVVGTLAFVFFTLGTITIVSFNPAAVGTGRGPLSGQTWIVVVLDGLLDLLAVVTYAGAAAVVGYVTYRLARGLSLRARSMPGQWAWALHRLTGIGIVGFLLVHVLDIMLLPLAPDLYNRTIASYASSFLIPMEVALVGAVLYHALNGVRLMVVEAWQRRGGRRLQVQLVGVVAALTVVLLLPSIVVLVRAAR